MHESLKFDPVTTDNITNNSKSVEVNLIATTLHIKSSPTLSINESSKNKLNCKAIVGAANNQLDSPDTGEWLLKNNIVYSPDYLVNSGGVIAIASEINKTENFLEKQLLKISSRLKIVLQESKKNKESTDSVAKRIAWERINSLKKN